MAPTFCNRCGDAVEEGCDPLDELAELDALSERIRLKRYGLKRKINRIHSPIVRQIPPDVTSTIFEFCLSDFADNDISLKDFSIPLSLGAICSYWREIAWSTPTLWSSLVVRVPNKHGSDLVTCIAQEWLARSGQLPLSIRIFSNLYDPIPQTMADIINQYSARWSDLDLFMPGHCYQRFHATDNHAPILKSIRFHCLDQERERVNFQLTCPRLERADFTFFSIDETNIQWDNLTHLTLHLMRTFDTFLILRKTPRLVFCKILGSSPRYRGSSIGAPILTSLRFLHLVTNFSDDFLNNLIAPHLEELSLRTFYHPSMEAITSFLRRSACSLRSFSMVFYTFQYFEDFMNNLQSTPSLNTLSTLLITISGTTPDYDARNILQLVAKVLSSQSTSLQQGFLPNLKILEYTGMVYLRPVNYDDLYSLPPADNAVHGPLHLLKLNLYPVTRIPENIISYFSSLVERGVTVNVMSNSEDILQSSIDYYRCRKDSLCRDWTDNFDSSLFLDFCGVSQIK